MKNPETIETRITLGKWTVASINDLLWQSARLPSPGDRISFLSEQFLDTPYTASTLIGSSSSPEVLVVNLEGVDCFTFLDYIEAMRLSANFTEFMQWLKKIRYHEGVVSFQTRNHFFTDWIEHNADLIVDATRSVGGEKVVTMPKTLNERGLGMYFVEGIPPSERTITYLPSMTITDGVLLRIRTGDYIGIYSPVQGLDVSHAGIAINTGSTVYLRHASSAAECRCVLDQNLRDYLRRKPGIVILRPKR